MAHTVIIGAGQAGLQAASSLRERGYPGAITVVGDEIDLPYQRPPLSKDFLADGPDPDPLPLRAERFFEKTDVDLRRGARAVSIDRPGAVVVLDTGERLGYSTLVLATGAANRRLEVPGSDLSGVHDLRTLTDAQVLRGELGDARSVAVVGAGFIGLEFAAAARKRGLSVMVLEVGNRPLARALSPAMADHIAEAHRGMGTDLRLAEGLQSFRGEHGALTTVVGASGREYPADLVLVGIGVRPRDELAHAAGLDVDNGIVVDHCLRTNDPSIFAVGDCAVFPTPDGPRRLESVQNATDQGRHVALAILGVTAPYDEVPWFWSNQGSLRLQIAGISSPADDTVLSGDVEAGMFSVLCFRADRLVAVESLGKPADHMAARRLLAAGESPTQAEASEPGFSLKTFAAGQTAAPR